MDVKYQIFVSSTFEDLRAERSAVIEQILNLQHIPVGMESFNAADDSQWNYIKRRIDRSDYYLVILAERYGSIEETTGKSYTQKEYEYAVEQGKPVVAFILDKASRATWPQEKVEFDKQAKLEEFRRLCQGRIVKFWRNADHLGALVSTSLSELISDRPGVGWIRGNSIPENVLGELASLSKENRELKVSLEKLQREHAAELMIPADVKERIDFLSQKVLYVVDQNGRNRSATDIPVLRGLTGVHRNLALGMSMGRIREEMSKIIDPDYPGTMLDVMTFLADIVSNNIATQHWEQGSMPMSDGLRKVYYLTEFGKDFLLYLRKYLEKKKVEKAEGIVSVADLNQPN